MSEATKTLVIVESPTKAQTLRRFLGADYLVASSVGHVRDLPANASEIPPKLKGEAWARLGVNVEKDFEPLYVVSPEKRKTIAELKKKLEAAGLLLLATDEDREGEAISWHLLEILKPKVPVRRMVFHEITKPAILKALSETREVDDDLVDAQEARRIIDRLFGYEVSPILWKKIAPRLSAGRVQSVAILMLVERERARMRFRAAEYHDLAAVFRTAPGPTFEARLATLGGARVATGNDFDPDTGRVKNGNAVVLGRDEARAIAGELEGGPFRILSNEEKPFIRRPAPPFTTSTLQQEGNRQLRFTARRTMKAAQRLYENGYITYMRTDSTALSGEAIRMTQAAIVHTYGLEYLPEKPRFYSTKVKNAQEAHEAIRPAGDRVAPIAEVAGRLGGDEARIYELIWKRTMACQMKDAIGRRRTVRAGATLSDGCEVVFVANGNSIDFPGFLRAYVEGSDDPSAALAERETILPPVAEGETVTAAEVRPEEHSTVPPPRLTEATLVKALEESGIGRPSTYASIIDTIERREYTFRKGTALVPTFTAFAVVSLLEQHFPTLIDRGFTAAMEDRLDAIARGEMERLPYLREFWFGDGTPGLKQILDRKIADIDARQVCSFPVGTDEEGREVVVRVGRFGTYVQRGEATAPLPPDTCPDEVDLPMVSTLLADAERTQKPLGMHPATGEPVYLRRGRFGPYVQLGNAVKGSRKKPKMVSVLAGMDPTAVDLETALRLLSLPRSLGTDPEGREVFACTGRYGPYVKRDTGNASLKPGDDVLTIGLARAIELFATKGKRAPRAKGGEPLRVFPAVEALGGAEVKLLDGRYGPYVTDGKVNATLPKGSDPAALTVEQAVELLKARAAAGPAKKRPRRKKAR
jgi:DNA topoisomerase-1